MNLHSCRIGTCWLAVDDGNIGPGGNPGQSLVFSGASNISNCRYAFNLNAQTQNIEFSNMYFEGLGSLGKLGIGANSSNGSTKLTGCTITFLHAAAAALSQNEPEIEYHLMNWGVCTFENCKISHNSGAGLLRFWNQNPVGGRLILRGCNFIDLDRNNRVQVGFQSRGVELVIEQTHTRNSGIGAVYNTNPKSAIVDVAVDGGANIVITQDITINSRGVAAVTSTAGVAVGDLMLLQPSSPTVYTPQTLDDVQFSYNYFGVVGYVSSIIADKSITIDGMPNGFPFGVNVKLQAVTWDNSGGSD